MIDQLKWIRTSSHNARSIHAKTQLHTSTIEVIKSNATCNATDFLPHYNQAIIIIYDGSIHILAFQMRLSLVGTLKQNMLKPWYSNSLPPLTVDFTISSPTSYLLLYVCWYFTIWTASETFEIFVRPTDPKTATNPLKITCVFSCSRSQPLIS